MASGAESMLGPAQGTFATQPTPGPDGQVAWTELTADESMIAIADRAGDVTRLSAPTAPFYYSWSPAGDRLGFLGSGPGSLIFGVVEDGQARAIDFGAPYYFDWSPDGDSLFVHRVGTDLGVLTLDGERVVLDESPAVFQAPQWGPAGVTYAITGAGAIAGAGVLLATADEPADLVVADSPGDASTFVTTLSAFSAFDRFEDRVAVLSFEQPPTGTLRIVSLTDGTTLEVAREVLAHRWSPDGRKLLMLRSGDQVTVSWEVWEDGAITPMVSFTPTTEFVRDYLPFWDQYARSLTLWSPASDAFTFTGEIDGDEEPGVYVQYLDGRRDRLGNGTFSAWGTR